MSGNRAKRQSTHTQGSGRTRPNLNYLDSSWEHELRSLLSAGAPPHLLDAFRQRTLARANEAAKNLPTEIQTVRHQLEQADVIRLTSAIDMLDAMRRFSLTGHENFGSDAMVELLAGIAATMPEQTVLKNLDEPFDPQLVLDVDAALRRIANMQLIADLNHLGDLENEDNAGLVNMLHLENRFDRMAGFDPHVRRVTLEVFTRIDDRCHKKLGYKLSDAVRFAHLYGQVRMIHTDNANEYLATTYEPFPTKGTTHDQLQWKAGHMVWFAINAAAHLEGHNKLEEELAEQLNITADELQRLASGMGTRIGTVTDEQLLTDNPLRHSPLLTLSTGEWMFARPIDFLHGAMEWAAATCSQDPALISAFDNARQKVAEDLPEQLLREVFGDHAVHRSATYPDTESDTEADVLVTLPGTTLIVECKGGRISREGRRGAPRRVERHIKDIASKANQQNARTINAIRGRKPFRSKAGQPLDLDPDATLLPITVTLDRVDPFGAFLSPSRPDEDEKSWIVSLTDLLLLTDILDTPSSFYAYVAKRRQLLNNGARVWVEADALGAWCENRLTKMTRIPDPLTRTHVEVVSRTSEWMNDYYTTQTINFANGDNEPPPTYRSRSKGHTKPHTQVPAACLNALDDMLTNDDSTWQAVTTAALSVTPKGWKPLERLLDKPTSRANKNTAKNLRKAITGWSVEGQVVAVLTPHDGQHTVRLQLP